MSDNGAPGLCKKCGGFILWARRNDDPERWGRPLDAMSQGAGVAIIDGVSHFVNIYMPHVCPAEFEDKTEAEEAKRNQVRDFEHSRDRDKDYKHANQRMRELGTERAFLRATMIDCVRCHVPAGEYCVNIPKAAKGIREYLKWPHMPRFIEGEIAWAEHGMSELEKEDSQQSGKEN